MQVLEIVASNLQESLTERVGIGFLLTSLKSNSLSQLPKTLSFLFHVKSMVPPPTSSLPGKSFGPSCKTTSKLPYPLYLLSNSFGNAVFDMRATLAFNELYTTDNNVRKA